MFLVNLYQCECLRCGYKWVTKFQKRPNVCSRCKSKSWDTNPKRKKGDSNGNKNDLNSNR
jgi:predicted Zn-ribbon and HTH transcriptional regulator